MQIARSQIARFMPSMPSFKGALLAALAGGVLGLLLFLLAWARLDTPDDATVQPVAVADVATPPGSTLPRPELSPASRNAAPALGAADVAAPVPRAPAPPPPDAGAMAPTSPASPAGPTAIAPPADGNPSLPQPIERVAPEYPADALRNGERGSVVVMIQVGTDGLPVTAVIERSSRSRALDQAALAAARRWRFRPALANGQPVEARVRVPFEFVPP